MNEFTEYSTWQVIMLFVGSSIAVFGILYKVMFIDEEELEAAEESGSSSSRR